jgi:uncharacterized protein
MTKLTKALVARHALGRADAYDAALLDIAQDHLLYLLNLAGAFEDGELIFKGGTSLRKCRLGNDGRFSTDLDFAAPNEETVLGVCQIIDGANIAGFHYRLESTRGDGRHWALRVTHDELGSPNIASSVEFARRSLALPAEELAFVNLPIHKNYELRPPSTPGCCRSRSMCRETRPLPPRCTRARSVRSQPIRRQDDRRSTSTPTLGPQSMG